uniref:Putative secreted peptide n=1 Tax=Anopheles braziliensis TaxID=58242 RepID=A0A2M3ZTS2_9DIPT
MASLSPTVVVVVVALVELAIIIPTIKPVQCYNKAAREVTPPSQLSPPPPAASPPQQTLLVAAAPAVVAPAAVWSPLVQRSAPYPALT